MVQLGDKLWTPSDERIQASQIYTFARKVERQVGHLMPGYEALHRWSVQNTGPFWSHVASFTGVRWLKEPKTPWIPPKVAGSIRGSQWFVGGRLNYAHNLLPQPGPKVSLVAVAEGRAGSREVTAFELWQSVALCARQLRSRGVQKGDRVAGVLINGVEAIVAMLATSSIGAVWASCSPDFGQQAIVDRLGQIAPRVVFYTPRYVYGGKAIECRGAVEAAIEQIASKPLRVAVDHLASGDAEDSNSDLSWGKFLAQDPLGVKEPLPIAFEPCEFADPLFILFSSGTTGVPKCIVHGVGGTLLQHKKELVLHTDLRPEDRLFFFTTCGWMMWNWMVSGLSVGASLVLFDGAPHVPSPEALWGWVDDLKVTSFGTSPKFLATCASAGISPKAHRKFEPLKTVLSTGSPLLPEQFSWVYQNIKSDLHLSSISGGTDIVSCFMLGVPYEPVFAGEIQRPGLGMAVEAWDANGIQVRKSEKGELVCTRPFVSMPVGFWNDPDGAKYRAAYFDYFQTQGVEGRAEVWRHGDFIAITDHGGIVVYGRSDATLNPGGVRIGTSELYRIVEGQSDVLDSVAIGDPMPDGDVRVVLFVRSRLASTWDESAGERIKKAIRSDLSPRHVPALILAVDDIPYTRSGKKVELAVLAAFLNQPVTNLQAIANPECLESFRQLGLRHRGGPGG